MEIPETLSARLATGPLPLAAALDCAVDAALSLRPPHDSLERPDQGHDVSAFGGLLYEIVTGLRPNGDGGGIQPLEAAPRQGPEALRSAAICLALRCLEASPGPQPNMQQVLMELRLFRVLARQWDAALAARPLLEETRPAEDSAPASAPLPDTHPVSSVRCPHCRSHYVYPSLPRTFFEQLLDRTGIRLHRCHRCDYRYVVLLGIAFSKQPVFR